jgi:hypothetical protein
MIGLHPQMTQIDADESRAQSANICVICGSVSTSELDFYTRGRYHPQHSNMCSTKGRVLPGLFVFTRFSGGRSCDDVRATDYEACQSEELSTL